MITLLRNKTGYLLLLDAACFEQAAGHAHVIKNNSRWRTALLRYMLGFALHRSNTKRAGTSIYPTRALPAPVHQ